ncbi:hypothetical protein FN976_06035 [Caenimonas sedimenti]|uniref:FecR protein domain-containing protein n=2 Tax=Caenimonas sedimenti TaxID=2596921 RepID=A0A562ZUJ1_9BURK|nr:hypothetical protein FN976_06035 [Caenimonas sedimenti]
MRTAKHSTRWLAALAAMQLLLFAPSLHAQSAGQVEFSRGVGFAQTPGQGPRTLGKGLELREGDRLTTSDGGSAVIKLQDGTRMTVRPNSELVLQEYRFKESAPQDNSFLMQLVRGGFRAVTGTIAKSSPNAAKVQTNTATIGIRGTDFDARICTRDCAAEASRVTESARPNAVAASAKIVEVTGEVNAVDPAGQRRRVVAGGSIYPGDTVETSPNTQAVMAFRDESKITLGSQTRFRVDNFVFDQKNAGEGRFLVSLLRGSARALTGLIGKANTRNVGFSTPTATIGIRGTGFDVSFDELRGTQLWTWLGSIEVAQGLTALQVLQAGQGLFLPLSGPPQLITNQPSIEGKQPDQVNVDNKQLFSSDNSSDASEGLFVFVRDGHIELVSAKEIMHLGKNEAGSVGNDGTTSRPVNIPKFLDFDTVPLPDSKNPLLVSILGESGIGKVCK